MARRFGRNQKRKLLEQLDDFEQRHHVDQVFINGLKSNRKKLEDEVKKWAYRISYLLGEGTAFARTFDRRAIVKDLMEEMIRYRKPYLVRPDQPLRLEPDFSAANIDVALNVIELFAIYAETRNEVVRDARVFLLTDEDGQVALAVDHQTLYQMKQHADPALIRYLLEKLIHPWRLGEVPNQARKAR